MSIHGLLEVVQFGQTKMHKLHVICQIYAEGKNCFSNMMNSLFVKLVLIENSWV